MIDTLKIILRRESIEIADGPYLGHECGVLVVDSSPGQTRVQYRVNGYPYGSLTAAMYGAMAQAYLYVARQEDHERK